MIKQNRRADRSVAIIGVLALICCLPGCSHDEDAAFRTPFGVKCAVIFDSQGGERNAPREEAISTILVNSGGQMFAPLPAGWRMDPEDAVDFFDSAGAETKVLDIALHLVDPQMPTENLSKTIGGIIDAALPKLGKNQSLIISIHWTRRPDTQPALLPSGR
jgi:hypothetical protein